MSADILADYSVPRPGDQARLTIVGDRQAGKTYQLQRIALEHARRGQVVVFDCSSTLMAKETFHYTAQMAMYGGFEPVERLVTYGSLKWWDGGRIIFRPSPRQLDLDLAKVTDVHLLDDTPHDLPFRCAKLVVRAVLR